MSTTKDELDARFAAAQAAMLVAKKKRSDALDLVEAVFGLRKPVCDIKWFIDAAKDADPTLRLENNENQLTVLAGCCLALMMSDEQDWSDVAGAIQCASFSGTRKPIVVASLLRLADDTVTRWQLEKRRNQDLPRHATARLDLKPVTETLTALDANAAGAATGQQVALLIRSVIDQANSALATNFKAASAISGALQHQILKQREELDMLWWVLGGWIPVLDSPLSDLSAEAASLAIGCELGDLTRICPAPYALPAIIHRALQQTASAPAEISLEEAIGATPTKLLASWKAPQGASMTRLAKITPVTVAIALALETPDGWRGSFTNQTALDPSASLTPLQFAMQASGERILIHQFAV